MINWIQGKYNPDQVANEILKQADKSGIEINLLKLLKLVYISHGFYMAFCKTPLINSPIQAWKHGPVIPSLYHEFKRWGRDAIKEKAKDFDDNFNLTEPYIDDSDIETKEIIGSVLKTYGHFSGIQLRNLTHEIGSPWHQFYIPDVKGIIIPNEAIYDHYSTKINKVSKVKV